MEPRLADAEKRRLPIYMKGATTGGRLVSVSPPSSSPPRIGPFPWKKVVHPAEARAVARAVTIGLSDEFVPGLVDRQDLQLEELTVPEPRGLPLHRLDLVVRPLQRTRRDHHVVVGQQTTPVRRQRLGHLLEHLD